MRGLDLHCCVGVASAPAEQTQQSHEQDDDIDVQRCCAVDSVVVGLWQSLRPGPVVADVPRKNERHNPIKNTRNRACEEPQRHLGHNGRDQRDEQRPANTQECFWVSGAQHHHDARDAPRRHECAGDDRGVKCRQHGDQDDAQWQHQKVVPKERNRRIVGFAIDHCAGKNRGKVEP